MSERAAYSRVYWSIVDDEEFRNVYDDDRLLACWLRLLLIADQAWPASAHIPSSARKASVAALDECGLIVRAGHRYRIRGLDAERERRKVAATSRGPRGDHSVSVREPRGAGTTGLRRDETSQDETNARANDDGREDLEAFLLVTRRAPSPRQRKVLDSVLERRDISGPQWAADIILRHPDDPIGAVLEADKAWRDEQIAAAIAKEKPKPRPRRRPGVPQSTRELIDHWAAAARSKNEGAA